MQWAIDGASTHVYSLLDFVWHHFLGVSKLVVSAVKTVVKAHYPLGPWTEVFGEYPEPCSCPLLSARSDKRLLCLLLLQRCTALQPFILHSSHTTLVLVIGLRVTSKSFSHPNGVPGKRDLLPLLPWPTQPSWSVGHSPYLTPRSPFQSCPWDW